MSLLRFLRQALEAVRVIGLANVFHTVNYTRVLDRAERPYLGGSGLWDGPWTSPLTGPGAGGWAEPGRAIGAETTPRRVRVLFEAGEVTLAALRPDLLEVTWREPRAALPLPEPDWPPVPVKAAESATGWTLRTSALEIRLSRDGGLELWTGQAGEPGVHLLRTEFPPLWNGEAVCHRVRLAPGERLYGLGERAAPLDRRGGVYRMWNRDPSGYGPGVDPVYLCLPVYFCRGGEGGEGAGDGNPGYLVFYANPYPAVFDLGRADPAVAEHRFAGGGLRYYLIPGPLDRALERYAELTGKPPLPPLWALGYHQSRWSYYPEARVRKLAEDFARHEVPVDAIHLDIHYLDGYRVFTVGPRRFPDLGGLARDLAARGIRLVTIIDPGVKRDPSYPLYSEGLRRGMFVSDPATGRPVVAPVWPGPCVFPDFTDPAVREWWGGHYKALLDAGVSGFWHDMNEPAAFVASGEPTLPLSARHATGDHRAVHNLYGSCMNQAGYEGLRRLDPGRRPFILSRSGWTGVQQHAWTWTADVRSDWDCLRMTVAQALGLGLSGVPFSGSDVGGFVGTPSPELYVRWLQMSAFMPFFRSHTMLDTPDQEPWSYGEPYTAIARDFIRLRYVLLPYIYTLAWEAATRGWPLVRPLFWANGATEAEDAFLLGDSLLVAPVVEKGVSSREVPVPAGLWYDFWTDAKISGPARVGIQAPLERIPILVKAGAVLPMQEPAASTTGRLLDRAYLHVYPPGAGTASVSRLFLDSGDGYGPSRVERYHVTREGRRLEIRWTVESDQGYPWPYKETVTVVHGTPLRHVEVDGVGIAGEGEQFTSGRFHRATLTT